MSELQLKKVNDEVFLATDDIVKLDKRAVEFIKDKANISPRGRARICAHRNASDMLHEMIIAIKSDSYIRPHRHHQKVESFHLIEGCADIVILDDFGEIIEIVRLGVNDNFYYRLSTPHYHTLIIHSSILVIHEITNGPFDVAASDYADFSPDDKNIDASTHYINTLMMRIGQYAKQE